MDEMLFAPEEKKEKYKPAKKDCFGYDSAKKKCSVLTDTYCRKKECKFYKPLSQMVAENIKYGKPAPPQR